MEFAALLCKETSWFPALREFVSSSKEFSSKLDDGKNRPDVVKNYINSSPTCCEFLQILEKEKLDATKISMVFSALECILFRLADDLKDDYTTGSSIADQILQSCSGHIQLLLSPKRTYGEIKSVVQFLTAAVLQGPATAKLVLGKVVFHIRDTQNIFERRTKQDSVDVRMALLQLVLSFLFSEDKELIQMLVEQRTLLMSSFPGLIRDSAATVDMFLTAILSQIINNHSIVKTLKMKVFSEQVILSLVQLFKWNGAPRVLSRKQQKRRLAKKISPVEAEKEDKEMVQGVTFNVLVGLCASHTGGIIFHDKTVGTSNRNFNPIMTKILSAIDKPYVNTFASRLVTQILQACPDQIKHYIPSLMADIRPRPSGVWLKVINFVQQIFTQQEPLKILTKSYSTSVRQMCEMVTSTCIPGLIVGKATVEEALKHEDMVVRDTLLSLLVAVADNLTEVLIPENLHDFLSPEQAGELTSLIQAALLQFVPSSELLVQCWEGAVTPQERKVDTPVGEEALPALPLVDHLKRILRLLSCRQSRHVRADQPQTHSEPPDGPQTPSLSLGGLIASVQQLEGRLSSTDVASIRLLVLQLMARAEHRNTLLTVKIEEETVTHVLLNVLCTTEPQSPEYQTALSLLKQLLLESGVFGLLEDELEVWMVNVQQFPQGELSSVVGVLGGAVREVVNHQITAQLTGETQLTKSPTVSPLVAAVLARLQKQNVEMNDGCAKFVTRVLGDILHTLQDPRCLLEFIGTHTQTVPPWFTHYIETLDTPPQLTKKIKKRSLDTGERPECRALREAFQARQAIDESVVASLSSFPYDSLFLIGHQLLFYMSHVVSWQDEESRLTVLKSLCDAWKAVVKRDTRKRPKRVTANSPFLGRGVKPLHRSDQTGAAMLKHSQLLEYFLNPDQDFQTCNLVSEAILHALMNLRHSYAINSNLEIFTEKLKNYIIYIRKKIQDKNCGLIPLTKVLASYWPVVSGHVVGELLGELIELRVEDLTVKEGLSDVGLAVVQLVDKVLDQPQGFLPHPGVLQKLLNLLSSVSGDTAAERQLTSSAILKLLRFSSLYATTVDAGSVSGLLEDAREEGSVSVAAELVGSNLVLVEETGRWVAASPRLALNPGLYLPVVQVLLQQILHLTRNGYLSGKFGLCLERVEAVYRPEISSLLCSGGEAPARLNGVFTSMLELDALDSAQQISLASELFDALKTGSIPVCQETIDLCSDLARRLTSVHQALDDQPPSVVLLHSCIKAYIQAAKNTALPQDSTDDTTALPLDSAAPLLLTTALQQIKGLSRVALSEAIVNNNKLWKTFVKTAIKSGLSTGSDGVSLELLDELCQRLYSASDKQNDVLPVRYIHKQLVGNDGFTSAMYHSGDNTTAITAKQRLAGLLVTLVSQDSSVCESAHIPVILAAYRASLGLADKKLLHLLWLYEQAGISIQDYKPYVWGEAAVEQYKVTGVKTEPKLEDILTLLDPRILKHSVLNFPLTIKLQVEVDESKEGNESIYDPRFLFPLFSQLLSPEYYVNCFKFLTSGALGLVFAGVSSHDNMMRACAQLVLRKYYQQLESARFHERGVFLAMLDIIRNGYMSVNCQLPCIITVFLARVCELWANSESPMFLPVMEYVLLKQNMDLFAVPEFFKFFHSSDLQHHKQVTWVLTLLAEGLRSPLDFRVSEKYHVMKQLLSFYDSATADKSHKMHVLSVIKSVMGIRPAAIGLAKNNALLAYIQGAVQNCHRDAATVTLLIDVMYSLWNSLTETRTSDPQDSEDGPEPASQQHVPLVFSSEFLLTLQALIPQFCVEAGPEALVQLLEVLAQSLAHCQKTQQFMRAQGNLVVVPEMTASLLVALIELHSNLFKQGGDESATTPSSNAPDSEHASKAMTSLFAVCLAWRSGNHDSTKNTAVILRILEFLLNCVECWDGKHVDRVVPFTSSFIVNDPQNFLASLLVTDDSAICEKILHQLFRCYRYYLSPRKERKTSAVGVCKELSGSAVGGSETGVTEKDCLNGLRTLNEVVLKVAEQLKDCWNRVRKNCCSLVERLESEDYKNAFDEIQTKLDAAGSTEDSSQGNNVSVAMAVLICEVWLGHTKPSQFRTWMELSASSASEQTWMDVTSSPVTGSKRRKSKMEADCSITDEESKHKRKRRSK